MESYRIESVSIAGDFDKIFAYIANPANLPEWTHAFREVRNGSALLMTPKGSIEIGLKTVSSPSAGTIDWHMTMPDGNVASAFSRLVRQSKEHCVFSFVLLAPPVPLEMVEGALAEQAGILQDELARLKRLLTTKN